MHINTTRTRRFSLITFETLSTSVEWYSLSKFLYCKCKWRANVWFFYCLFSFFCETEWKIILRTALKSSLPSFLCLHFIDPSYAALPYMHVKFYSFYFIWDWDFEKEEKFLSFLYQSIRFIFNFLSRLRLKPSRSFFWYFYIANLFCPLSKIKKFIRSNVSKESKEICCAYLKHMVSRFKFLILSLVRIISLLQLK